MSRLRAIREARGLSQAEVAAPMNVTPTTISRYEQEDQRLTLPIMGRLAKILGCSIGQIAGEVEFAGLTDAPAPLAPPLDRERLIACIDALDHFLAENGQELAPGGRGDVVAAIYDWTIDENMAVADVRDLSRIRSLLRPYLRARAQS